MRTRTELFLDGTGRVVEVIRLCGMRKVRHANGIILAKRAWWERTHPYAKFPAHLRDPWPTLPKLP